MATHKKTKESAAKKTHHAAKKKDEGIDKKKKDTGHHFVRHTVKDKLDADVEAALNNVVRHAEKKIQEEEENIEDVVIDEIEVDDIAEEEDFQEEEREETEEKISRQRGEGIDAALEDIYKNTDGSLPDMQQFTKKKGGRFFRALFSLLFACAALAAVFWVGLFILKPGDGFSEEDIILTVSAEEQLRIGDDVHFRIRYVNAQQVALAQASLQVRFPEGFIFKESSIPADDTDRNDTWTLGALEQDESGYIDVYGTMFGDNGEEQSMRVFFTYKPENFSSEFQKVATVTVATNKSPVRLELSAPDEAIAGAQQPITIAVDKDEDAGFVGPIAIEIIPDGQFVKKEQSIESDQFNEFRWTLPVDDRHITLNLEGSFVPGPDQERARIPVRVIGWQDNTKQGDTYILSESLMDIALINEDVVVSAVINGANTTLSVQPGDTLNVSVSLRNSGDVALDDINLQAILDAPSYQERSILGWNELVDTQDGDIRGEQINDSMRRGVISWNKRHVVPLTRLGPDDELLLDFSIPIRDADQTALANFDAFQATVSIDVQYNVNGKLQTASTKPITVTINSDLLLDVRDQIARAGDTEEHTVTWLLSNSFHDLSNIRVTADVYGNTSFDEGRLVVPAGAASYDNDKQQLTWTLDSMPVSIDVLPLQFTLVRNGINPSQTQLMSAVTLRATDTKTGEEIILIGDEISLIAE